MGICCVEGCHGKMKDIVYFEFPTSRNLRRKWLDVLNIGKKVPLGTLVCSQHFSKEEYEVIRGKVRLKRKVVPTLMLDKKTPEISTTEQICPEIENPVLPDEKLVENSRNSVSPKPESTMENISGDGISEDSPSVERKKERRKSKEDMESLEICKVINKNRSDSIRSSVERNLPDPKQPPDFEEMITNYQIKNNKQHSLLEREIEIEVPGVCEGDNTIVVDDRGDAPPVFIEIPVDKGNPSTGNSDCLMVLESVQVEVDPTSLLLSEDHDELQRNEQTDIQNDRNDPISLLTSSDEDEVIIQEPHIDTVEVSDATDEDDVPLVKLVKKQTNRPTKKKKPPEGIPWNGIYDLYCVQCHFTTTDSLEYTKHLQEHEKIIQVCSHCQYTTASKNQLKRHLRKHKEEKQFKCHICDYRARHNVSLIYHKQSHEADKHFVKNIKKGYKCVKCGFKSTVQTVVLGHVRGCGGSKVFPCDNCDYVSKRKSDLKRHWISRHRNDVVEVDLENSQD